MRLSGKTAIITGATSGIGAAIARRFAIEGAQMVITGRNADRGAEVGHQIRLSGALAEFCCADLNAADAPGKIASLALDRFGRIDILVNNAGIILRGTAAETSDEDWDRVIGTNITSVFRMSRAVLPSMVAQGGGSIVNIASDWALVGAKGAVAYGVSKGAVAQLTRSMALDHAGDGIRINAVCPGDTDTAMLDSAIRTGDRQSGLAALGLDIPMGRVARPDEIAGAAVFLASDDASFVTGALLPVDGGNTAQ